MPIYLFKCQECGTAREKSLPLADFRREMGFECEGCGCETPHRSVPVGGAFSCKGTGWPSSNSRMKKARKEKSSKKTQVMVDREKSGEGVSGVQDLGKPMR